MGDLRVDRLCSHCHRLPGPEVLPKEAWPATIFQMAALGGFGANVPGEIDLEAVAAWYVDHAPEELPPPQAAAVDTAPQFQPRVALTLPDTERLPFVSSLCVADLGGPGEPSLVICDMHNGGVWRGSPTAAAWAPQKIADLPSPARAEAVDLDQDGRVDLVVAVLGSPMAMDHLLGQVVWLRQTSDGAFETIVLDADLGRVADVQPGDFDGDGDIDLAVAEFGWRQTGHVFLLTNQPQPDGTPRFERTELDGNHGASRLLPVDVDCDGRLDLVALFAQEHELVRIYRNGETGWSQRHDVYRAPHPAWGHASMQLADIDGDGDADILLANGDAYDNAVLKPSHGLRWLENRGDFSFAVHDLAEMPGCYAAAAADLDGDGDIDLVASALAEPQIGSVDVARLPSLIWLEQTEAGGFRRHVLEVGDLRHPVLALHDHDANGLPDIVVGNGCFDDTLLDAASPCVQIWINATR
ncbi:MAG: FG-GAP-like repeat-containing protein [Planctomycetota bacterium]|nr:FG-GAP-like repeat-containing protein [Planctomycetota bacterium]